MELDRYTELLEALRKFRQRFAESIKGRIQGQARLTDRARAIHRSEGAGEEYPVWLDRFARRAAVNFILKVLFLRVLEDRDLLRVHRIRGTDSERMWEKLAPNLGPVDYLDFCFRDAAYLLPDLFEKAPVDLVPPDEESVREFLNLWRQPDPDRPGWLRFDFRGDGFDTRFIGDIYQHIDDEARDYYALVQTPEFISQFLLEHTLLKRFQEKDFEEVTLLDLTCGSGHLLVDAFGLWRERYVERYPGWPREKVFRIIIERHLFGADINEYACALARFRLLIEGCNWAGVGSLNAFRDLHFNIVCCDSLIPYEDPNVVHQQVALGQTGAEVAVQIAETFGAPETVHQAAALFSRRYDVAVGNPPYISPKDPRKRQLYREWYPSAYGKYGLAAPFVERFLQLVERGGRVGMINTNAFARRQYGRKLIEEVLPRYDLEAVIDLSGAHIPGHGTPTLILFARNQPPTSNTVIVLSNLKGEPGTPADPAQGEVWKSVARGFAAGPGYAGEYVDMAARPRKLLSKHPWQFGGALTRLFEYISSRSVSLEELSETFGYSLQTNADEVYRINPDFARRLGIRHIFLKPLLIGEPVRDWFVSDLQYYVYPYDENFNLVPLGDAPGMQRYLVTRRSVLENRVVFSGESYAEAARPWYEYHQFSTSKHKTPYALAFPEIATHNHFVFETGNRLYNRTAPIVKLSSILREDYSIALAILNTNVVCFCLKQICFNKKPGNDPIRDNWVFASTYIGKTPIPRDYEADTPNRQRMLALAEEMIGLAEQLPTLTMRKLFEKQDEAYHTWNSSLDGYVSPHPDLPPSFTTARELREARDWAIELRRDIRQRMIFLQEEIDWLAYGMYGLLGKPPLAEDYLSREELKTARLELGQRAFEQAGKGYKGDWCRSWRKGAKDHLPGPTAELPELCSNLQRLIRDRMDIIAGNQDIALLEDPLYKRRWIPPNYDKEFREALECWLREMAEHVLEQAGRPLTLREWAHRLSQKPRILAAIEVYTGTPMFDLQEVLAKVVRAEAVPNRPEDYLKPSGLEKLRDGRFDFKAGDFARNIYWKVRGKLNIPRERYIEYREMGTAGNGTYYGWAGWGAVDRAKALAYLLQQAMSRGLTDAVPRLRESLKDLLPELREQLAEWEYAEFEALGR